MNEFVNENVNEEACGETGNLPPTLFNGNGEEGHPTDMCIR